jgi:methionine-rich copper-binding protein CopC
MRSVSSIVLITLALLIAPTSAAMAHAHLEKSSPPGDSTVRAAPAEITLWFSEALEPEFCKVEVLDLAGNRVDQGKAAGDAKDAN